MAKAAKAKAAPKAKPKAPARKKKVAPRTKTQIIAALAESAGITKSQAKIVYATLLEIAYTGAKSPTGIMLPGLGKLIKVRRKARVARNPATGEPVKVPAKTVVKFRLAKACKEAVLN
jgi:DNA-binding protein HU-beta